MRVVLSNASNGWGGVHEVTEAIARGLAQRGHEVVLLCHPGSRLEERMRSVVPVVPILRGMDFSPAALWRVRSTLRKFRPDVALTLTKKDVRLTAPVARALGIPVIVRHANDRPLRNVAYHRFLYGTLPAHHVANSQATRATLLASAPWLDPSRMSVIYNGIDPAAFDVPAADLGLPTGTPRIGFVGRFDERKGVLDLAAAWPQVTAALPDARLVLVGTGEREADMRALLADQPRVDWLGLRRDVPAVMKAMDMIVMPSHWEGFGLVAAEAMAAGRAVIVTDVSSLPEIVRDGVDGLLVPAHEPDALADAMIRLGADATLRARMGTAGRERAVREFSIASMIDAYESLLQDHSR
jgi:glycosyltransferase involved in cell wall biosynthesis